VLKLEDTFKLRVKISLLKPLNYGGHLNSYIMPGWRNFKFPHNENFHFPSQVSTISQMNKMGKIASHIFVLFFIPVYFSNNLLYDFFFKKLLKTFNSITFSVPSLGPESQLNTSLCPG